MDMKAKRIFIVEDNTQNRIIFQLSLLRENVFLHFERHGWDAINQLKMMGEVDLIVMDLALAEDISGFDLAAQIRAIPEYAKTLIVAVSAMDPDIAIPQAQAQGLAGFIAKPIDGQLFYYQILTILGGEKVWDAGRSRL
jgi:CheY-like chemotaxis protein